ncbi:hypothetical protein VPHD479_0047 [Vibrio phage D479]
MTNFKLVRNAVESLNAKANSRYEIICHVDPLTQERVLSTATYTDESQAVLEIAAVEYFRCDTNEEVFAKLAEADEAIQCFNTVIRNEPTVPEVVIEETPDVVATKPTSKKERFAALMAENDVSTRKQAIELAVEKLEMSKAGASTYWANFNKAK